MDYMYLNKDRNYDSQNANRYCQFKMLKLKRHDKIIDINTNEFLTIFVVEGKLFVEWKRPNFTNQIIHEREMIFVPKTDNCTLIAIQDTLIITHACNIPVPKLLQITIDYLKPIASQITVELPTLPIRDIVMKYLDLLIEYFTIGKSLRYIHEIKEAELFCLFKIAFTQQELSSFYFYGIHDNLEFHTLVLNSYSKIRTAKELAEKCGYDRLTFQRLFKSTFNDTPYHWLQNQIAYKIRNDLIDQKIPIKDIVINHNFSSASSLTIFCRRVFGKTPTEIRNNKS